MLKNVSVSQLEIGSNFNLKMLSFPQLVSISSTLSFKLEGGYESLLLPSLSRVANLAVSITSSSYSCVNVNSLDAISGTLTLQGGLKSVFLTRNNSVASRSVSGGGTAIVGARECPLPILSDVLPGLPANFATSAIILPGALIKFAADLRVTNDFFVLGSLSIVKPNVTLFVEGNLDIFDSMSSDMGARITVNGQLRAGSASFTPLVSAVPAGPITRLDLNISTPPGGLQSFRSLNIPAPTFAISACYLVDLNVSSTVTGTGLTISVPVARGASTNGTAAPSAVCPGAQVLLTSTYSGTATGSQWSDGTEGGQFTIRSLTQAVYVPTASSAERTVLLTVTATQIGFCGGDAATSQVPLRVFEAPVVSINISDASYCETRSVSLRATSLISSGEALSGMWSSAAGVFSDPRNPQTLFSPSAGLVPPFQITWRTASRNGCVGEAIQSFSPPDCATTGGLPLGAIIGIAVGSVIIAAVIAIVAGLFLYKRFTMGKDSPMDYVKMEDDTNKYKF